MYFFLLHFCLNKSKETPTLQLHLNILYVLLLKVVHTYQFSKLVHTSLLVYQYVVSTYHIIILMHTFTKYYIPVFKTGKGLRPTLKLQENGCHFFVLDGDGHQQEVAAVALCTYTYNTIPYIRSYTDLHYHCTVGQTRQKMPFSFCVHFFDIHKSIDNEILVIYYKNCLKFHGVLKMILPCKTKRP